MQIQKRQTQAMSTLQLLKKPLPALALPLAIASTILLAGCNEQVDSNANPQPEAIHSSESVALSEAETDLPDATKAAEASGQVSTRNQPLSIDWSRIDSGQKPVAPDTFKYPFELEGESVKSQAKFSNITPKQAQHTLTVGMASNEPLEKILDQLGDSYLSHKFSESEAKLIIYTTPNVEPSKHNYVIAHEFARGLTLPIEIIPRTADQKSDSAQPATEHLATEQSSTE